jgi:tetratricopeptide (TPR) repeat protein
MAKLGWRVGLVCLGVLLSGDVPFKQKAVQACQPITMNKDIQEPEKMDETSELEGCRPLALDEFSGDLLQAAIAVAQRIPDPQQKVEALTAIASDYRSFGQNQPIGELTRQILAVADTIVQPTDRAKIKIEALAAIAREANAAGETKRVNELTQQILATAKLIPAPIVRAIALADVAGSYQAAKIPQVHIDQFLTEAVSTVAAIKPSSSEKDDALTQISFSYASNGQVEQALKVDQLSSSSDLGLGKSAILRIGIETLVEAGNYEEALRLTETVEINPFAEFPPELAAQIPPEARSQLAKQLMESNRYAQLYELLFHLDGPDEPNQNQKEFIDRLLVKILQEIETVKDPGTKLDYQILAGQQFLKLGQKDRANELFSEAIDTLDTLQSLDAGRFDVSFLIQISEGLIKAGQPEKAIQLLQKFLNTPDALPSSASSLLEVTTAYQELGQTEQANQLLAQTLAKIQRLPDTSEKADALLWIATMYLRIKQTEPAKMILAQVVQMPADLREESADMLTDLFIQLEQYDQAFAIAKAADREDSLVDITRIYVEANQYDAALKVAQAIPDPYYRSNALTAIATQYTKSGQKDRGLALMTQAIKLAQTAKPSDSEEPDEEYQTAVLFNILSSYLQTGEEAQVFQLAQSIQNPDDRQQVLVRLVTEYQPQESDELPKVDLTPRLAVVNAIADPQQKAEGLYNVTILYGDRHQFFEAIQVIQQMSNSLQKVRALTALAYRHAGTEHKPDAKTVELLEKLVRSL